MKLNLPLLALSLAVMLAGAGSAASAEITLNGVIGYQDTPLEPGGQWHVHDPARPQPPVVAPGKSFSENATPPADAIVLFDGKDMAQWRAQKTGGESPWKLEAGAMIADQDDIRTAREFGDLQLHLEFRVPPPTDGVWSQRGNSGVFLMGLFEIQIFDCYQNKKIYADGATAGIYGQHPPQANVCRPPGEWQTYDILFTAPRFDAKGELVSPAYVTVTFNGVVVQNHQSIRGTTNHKSPGSYTKPVQTGPLALQYHHSPVAFRNIWVRPVSSVDEP